MHLVYPTGLKLGRYRGVAVDIGATESLIKIYESKMFLNGLFFLNIANCIEHISALEKRCEFTALF